MSIVFLYNVYINFITVRSVGGDISRCRKAKIQKKIII